MSKMSAAWCLPVAGVKVSFLFGGKGLAVGLKV